MADHDVTEEFMQEVAQIQREERERAEREEREERERLAREPQWEHVQSNDWHHTRRMRVPGGWIYNVVQRAYVGAVLSLTGTQVAAQIEDNKWRVFASMVFVPDAEVRKAEETR
jgi:hypothetical protein